MYPEGMRVLTSAQCQEADRLASESGVPVELLMQRAGWAVAQAAIAHLSLVQGLSVGILCGKGNNGGDGLVAARLLAQRGVPVRVWISAIHHEMSTLCQREFGRLPAEVLLVDSPERSTEGADLVIDALLGTGATGAPSGVIAEAIHTIRDCGLPVLSVDIPSGVNADSGIADGDFVQAVKTVTFAGPKRGFFQNEGLLAAGEWSLADIGFGSGMIKGLPGPLIQMSAPVPPPGRSRDAHKGTTGRLLIIAGSSQYPGAAYLAVRAALKAGVGYVAVATPGAESLGLPEAIRIPLPSSPLQRVEKLLELQDRFDAAVIGPGLGEDCDAFLKALFPQWTLPTCLDADALNAISRAVRPPHCPIAATPHVRELARLLGKGVKVLQEDRYEAVAAGAQRLDGACLLKGPATLITDGSGATWVNPTGNPGMASAGMGDVLAGLVGAYLSWGFSPLEALRGAAWVHGAAADSLGRSTFLASEVAEAIPAASGRYL